MGSTACIRAKSLLGQVRARRTRRTGRGSAAAIWTTHASRLFAPSFLGSRMGLSSGGIAGDAETTQARIVARRREGSSSGHHHSSSSEPSRVSSRRRRRLEARIALEVWRVDGAAYRGASVGGVGSRGEMVEAPRGDAFAQPLARRGERELRGPHRCGWRGGRGGARGGGAGVVS